MKKMMLLSTLLSFGLMGCSAHSTQNNATSDNTLSPGNPLPLDMQVNDLPSSDGNAVLKPVPIEQDRKVEEDIYTANYQEHPDVVRYGRYTLVASSPVGGQKYLLEQLVQVNMKKGKKNVYTLSVEQGLWNTLKDTGFTLCNVASPEVRSLFNHQLPKVHYQFGPMRLREALQMISGEAYELTVNDTLRQVCFERRSTVPKMVAPMIQVESTQSESEIR